MALTFVYFSVGLGLNIYYNFVVDYRNERSFIMNNTIVSVLIAIMQGVSAWYAQSMFFWYIKMAKKNMHAIE